MRTPQHISVASALSPRFRAVLAEAWRFARHFDSRFSILHAGAATDEKIALFQAAIDSLGLPTETMIACADGEPAPALLSLATAHRTDLLIAGALERDVERHFLSSVARTLLRESPGSLMLFTQPSEDPQPLRQIVLVTDFTQAAHEAVQFALHLAEREQAEVLHVLSVLTPFATARTEADDRTEEDRLDDFVSFAADSPASIDARVIHSTTGMAVADFTKTVGADLLIIPASSDPDGRTQLPTCVDWVTQVIPCNLLVVKPAR